MVIDFAAAEPEQCGRALDAHRDGAVGERTDDAVVVGELDRQVGQVVTVGDQLGGLRLAPAAAGPVPALVSESAADLASVARVVGDRGQLARLVGQGELRQVVAVLAGPLRGDGDAVQLQLDAGGVGVDLDGRLATLAALPAPAVGSSRWRAIRS